MLNNNERNLKKNKCPSQDHDQRKFDGNYQNKLSGQFGYRVLDLNQNKCDGQEITR